MADGHSRLRPVRGLAHLHYEALVVAFSALGDEVVVEAAPLLVELHDGVLPARRQDGTLSSYLAKQSRSVRLGQAGPDRAGPGREPPPPPVCWNCPSASGYCSCATTSRSFPRRPISRLSSWGPDRSRSPWGSPWPGGPGGIRAAMLWPLGSRRDYTDYTSIAPHTHTHTHFYLDGHVQLCRLLGRSGRFVNASVQIHRHGEDWGVNWAGLGEQAILEPRADLVQPHQGVHWLVAVYGFTVQNCRREQTASEANL